MGLAHSAHSTPADRLALAAKNGDARALTHLLATTRCDANQVDRAGFTPLVHAASIGATDAVAVLLSAGAAVNRASVVDGGTALHAAVAGRHVAAVVALLCAGASPFQENGRGQTAVDTTIRAGDAGLARRLEAEAADFSGDLAMKVPRLLGLGADWRTRYVVVAPRFACPVSGASGGGGSAIHRRTLFAFKGAAETVPACRLWLDGSAARAGHARPGRPPACELTLHPAHAVPAGAHTTTSGRRCGFTLHFRAVDESATAAADLARFVAAANGHDTGPPVAGRAVATEADAALARRLQAEEVAAAAGAAERPWHPPAVAAFPSAPPLPAVPPSAPALPSPAWEGGQAGHSQSPVQAGRAASAAPGDGSSWRPASRSPSPGAERGASEALPPPRASRAVPVAWEEDDGAGADERACAICLSAPARVGFLHGETIHRCCCGECARAFQPGGPCPLCRRPVEKICLVF
jgi:hypothetical protein